MPPDRRECPICLIDKPFQNECALKQTLLRILHRPDLLKNALYTKIAMQCPFREELVQQFHQDDDIEANPNERPE